MKQKQPGDNRQRETRGRQRRIALTAFCVALAAIMLGLAVYIFQWYANQSRIEADGQRYAQLYHAAVETAKPTAVVMPTPAVTEAPTATPTAVVTEAPTPTPVVTEAPTPTPVITEAPTPVVTEAPTPVVTEAPTATPTAVVTKASTATPTPVVTEAPTATPAPTAVEDPTAPPAITFEPTPIATPDADMPIVNDEPIPTPDAGTLVLALPTAPPVQSSFDALLAINDETVGFLTIEGMIELPVVQRENDNDFYLTHSFERTEAKEGALFMDGLNRLVPEDDCLIVYGHNMKNDTMFGKLDAYEQVSYVRQHPVVRFDTLYENRSYVVFAGFTASMKRGDAHYFDVRNFIFDEVEFDKFVLKLQSRSRYRVPVDMRYGDRLLLLVTCDYTNRQGRFILALRQLRPDETEAEIWAQTLQTEAK